MKSLDAMQDELEQIPLTKDEAIKLASDRQQQISQLTKAGYEQAKLFADLESKLADLELKLAERTQREKLLDQEMIKAEAQIDLIKDVLLRDPGI